MTGNNMEQHAENIHASQTQAAPTKTGMWAILAVVSVMLMFFAPNYAQFQLSPLAHAIMPQFGLDTNQFSALFSAAMIPGIALSLVAGLMCDRFGTKRTIAVGGAITVLALIARIFAPDFTSLFVCMVLAGMVATFVNANAGKIMGAWFDPSKLGIAVGVAFASGTLAQSVGMGTSALFPSINVLFIFTAALGVFALVFWMLFFREGPAGAENSAGEATTHKPLGECLSVVLKSRNIWILGVALGLCMAVVMCIATFLPHALQNVRGFDPARAGAVASVYTIGSLVGSLFIPVVNARVGRLKPVVIVLALIAAAGAAFGWQLPEGILMNAVLFITGVCLGGILVSLMSVPVLLPEIGPVYAGTGGGVAATLQLVGAVVVPSYIMTPIIGQNFTVFYLVAGVLALGAAGAVFLLPEVLKKH